MRSVPAMAAKDVIDGNAPEENSDKISTNSPLHTTPFTRISGNGNSVVKTMASQARSSRLEYSVIDGERSTASAPQSRLLNFEDHDSRLKCLSELTQQHDAYHLSSGAFKARTSRRPWPLRIAAFGSSDAQSKSLETTKTFFKET